MWSASYGQCSRPSSAHVVWMSSSQSLGSVGASERISKKEMNSKKASRSRGVRTWPVVVLRRRVLGGCACAGDRVLRGDGRGLVWLRVQVQVLGPLRGRGGRGRCEEKDARGKRGRAPTLRGGESRTESRETHESGGGRRLLLRKHPEMHICRRTGASAACAAREKGVGVIVPGARVVWEGRRTRALKISQNISSVSFRNTHRAVQRSRHLHGLPIAFSIARHSTARPRRRRGRLPASSFPRQPLGPKDKENKRDLILLPSRFGETSTRFRRETRRGNESTGSRLGARDMPLEGAGRHAVVLGRFDRAFSMPTTEKTLVARLNFTCSRRGTAQKRFTHPYHDHLTRVLPRPPPPSHP